MQSFFRMTLLLAAAVVFVKAAASAVPLLPAGGGTALFTVRAGEGPPDAAPTRQGALPEPLGLLSDGTNPSTDERVVMDPEPPHRSAAARTALTIAGSVGVTALLVKTDQQTSDALGHWKSAHHFVGQSSRLLSSLGDGRPTSAMFGGVFGYAVMFDDQNARRLGALGLESFALSGVATQLLKQVFSRQRPNVATRSAGTLFGPFALFRQRGSLKHGMSFFDAFPSGHTATMFSAAATVADFYPERWVSYGSYALASMVGLSRITERAHWASDVFVGAIVGYCSTKIIEHMSYNTKDFSLSPKAEERGIGMALSIAR